VSTKQSTALEPHNVLVGADSRARVMDFGLARSASTDSIDATRRLRHRRPTTSPTSI